MAIATALTAKHAARVGFWLGLTVTVTGLAKTRWLLGFCGGIAAMALALGGSLPLEGLTDMAKTPWEMAAVGKEYSHQTALFAWAAMARLAGVEQANEPLSYQIAGRALANAKDPLTQLKWLHAIKNAEKGGSIRGAMSVAEGVRAGVADVFLPVIALNACLGPGIPFLGGRETPYGWWHAGLYLELKRPGTGKPSDKQLEFQADMRAEGYACEIVFGWEAARDMLLAYLGKG